MEQCANNTCKNYAERLVKLTTTLGREVTFRFCTKCAKEVTTHMVEVIKEPL